MWYDDALANVPDWRTSSKEEALKHAHLWNPREDQYLAEKKNLAASAHTQKSMDLHIPQRDTEHGPGDAIETDAQTLCAWVSRFMPPLPWSHSIDDCTFPPFHISLERWLSSS